MQYIYYRFRILSSQKSPIFWAILFPIILSTLFSIAFKNLMVSSIEDVKVINIVVTGDQSKELIEVIEDAKNSNNEKIFDVKDYSKEKALKELENNNIVAYVEANKDISLKLNNSSLDAILVKTYLDSFLQVSSSINNVVAEVGTDFKYELNFEKYQIKKNDIKNEVLEPMLLPFYSVIGMAVMFSSFFGLSFVSTLNPLRSASGATTIISGFNVFKLSVIDISLGSIITTISNIFIYFYIKDVLNVDLGGNILQVVVTLFIGSILAICTGYIFGLVFFKTSKENILNYITAFTLIGSFLSGMMIPNIPLIIDNYFPLIQKINPVYLITNCLFNIRYDLVYDIDRLYLLWLNMAIIITIFIVVIYQKLGRKSYDNL